MAMEEVPVVDTPCHSSNNGEAVRSQDNIAGSMVTNQEQLSIILQDNWLYLLKSLCRLIWHLTRNKMVEFKRNKLRILEVMLRSSSTDTEGMEEAGLVVKLLVLVMVGFVLSYNISCLAKLVMWFKTTITYLMRIFLVLIKALRFQSIIITLMDKYVLLKQLIVLRCPIAVE
ncbi:hypothetical protein PVK06_008054 [Gossypium arboreum]|uniref:Uncharacterized protein n=1 Tax=Gossypium arboreum TaxID=29729 RepID=A0ABR0QJ52_GOSAR|nr:hypothetical protein PVK06_008054 [Gossypium arboreum]